MEKRDISGKKQYKELLIKPFRRDLSRCCFIAVRTTLDPLDFFAGIFRYSNYLFQLSKQTFDIVQNSICFSFQSFEIQDISPENTAFCLVNKSINKEQYLLGKNKNACYLLPKKRSDNQISLSFENEIDKTEQGGEENDWNAFKNSMENTSVDLMGKIDYIFPVEIQTYEILEPLFLKFPDIEFLNHQNISPKSISEIDLFLSLFHEHIDKIRRNSLGNKK